ncbi:MAG: sn-glycerol-1-phosphate dehydrogenase [Bacillota bacterium]|nr:sn-glycerol-1-phosphate dehydrogenase [Bacillota bacterium]HOB92169.1 sn-glycerol-1-phosphate dehydrogenase [Bacillota bacterium]HPZ53973.1 sn-glycerol-1-phosphate dehydrogenase [Bacillota bacterium]HQD17443.1 sn-glycerol-1-phosphate dehydrogenase [Bacillota bacterium]
MQTNLIEKANKTNCICGRDHKADIKDVIIAKGALDNIRDIVQQASLGTKAAIICDRNTYEAAGKRVESLLSGFLDRTTVCMISGDDPVVPDESALGKVLIALEPNTDFLIAVGSGTICDITRHVAHKLSIPFISVATAPSMDGYASSISSLIVDGVKTTLNGKLPTIIVGDTDVLSNAPEHMKAAGFGDLIGKVTARLDWRLANMINGEYICEYTIGLVRDILSKCLHALQKDTPDHDELASTIMEGLVMSGLGIAMIGKSRAASGAEHHISHFLEMKAIAGEAPNYLHGEKVSLGTYIMSVLYHKVFSHDFAQIEKLIASPPHPQIKEERITRLNKAFGRTAPAMIDRWRSNLPDAGRKQYVISFLASNWSKLQDMVREELPNPDELASILDLAKSPYNFKQMGYERPMIEDAIICSKEISQKYSLLYVLDEIGLLEHFAYETLEDLADQPE